MNATPIRPRRPWYTQPLMRAAAALVLTVGGGAYVLSEQGADKTMAVAGSSTLMDSAMVSETAPAVAAAAERRVEPSAKATAPPADVAPRPAPSPKKARESERRESVVAESDAATRARGADARAKPSPTVLREQPTSPKVAAPAASPPPSPVIVPVPTLAGAAGGRGVAGGVAKNVAAADQLTGGYVAGLVVTPQNAPVEGAAVMVSGTSIATTTNARGEFALRTPADTATLLVRRLGYTTSRLALSARSDDTARTRVTLEKSTQALENLVVTSAAAPLRQEQAGPVKSCWDVQARGTATSSVSLPRAIHVSDLSSSVPASSDWIGWPGAGDNTAVTFRQDARGSVTATAETNGTRLTLQLSQRDQGWEGTATQRRAGATIEQRISLVPASVAVCKP